MMIEFTVLFTEDNSSQIKKLFLIGRCKDCLSQYIVYPCLISRAVLLDGIQYIGINFDAYRLFLRRYVEILGIDRSELFELFLRELGYIFIEDDISFSYFFKSLIRYIF